MGDRSDDTSIRIKIETWKRLKDLKTRPNQSFDDVIQELLDEESSEAEGNSRMAPVTAD